MFDRRRKNDQLALLLQLGFALVLVFIAPVFAGEEKTGKHLFILSGQSNMTGAVKAAFTTHVEEQYGKENSVVVMRMKSGRGIRFWVADYRQPTGRGISQKAMNSNGQEYKPLIEDVLAAAKNQSFDSVGFIWMQGESDANNRLSDVYEESFLKLVKQLKNDLAADSMYFVIGRINDYAKGRPDNGHWKRVRETQIKLGKTPGNAWIDTDDLNGGNADNPDGDIHFPREGALRLGRRFADKAIEIINSKK
ncbi:sialate O-acetylesterase [Akkermansiaceae bacterium]|nr:sialate O-acetylesterase [Akkermansiaceae bacterium]MDB4404968.1 sialate O-acetylesterase [bacterium]MDA7901022.1 sialate O-acetylesterase [Akkermansiaceae bacterium]MDA7928071.1 sialate O-acetylesterase [Akkermansiaceae bacterium]MDB4420321.1 sialate O-acetylesterase [Akkermansiaceae bacterium]